MSNTREVEAKAAAINQASFIGRVIAYSVMFIPMYLFFAWLALMTDAEWARKGLTGITAIDSTLVILLIASPFIVWERAIRRFRRKHGLPVNKNIARELAQMEVNQRVAMEQAALKKAGTNGPVDKSDLGYWHGLLQQGAITEEEYQSKKKELM